MKLVILYRPKSGYASHVERFAHDFQARHATAKLELVNIDEREGVATASLYDIMQYPAILALAGDGRLLQLWQGEQLPLMNDVASYVIGR